MGWGDTPGNNSLRVPLVIFGSAVLLIFVLYIAHLFKIQIVDNLVWEGRARAVALRSESLPAQRGLIWDRNEDEPLAMNIDSFAINVIPAEIDPAVTPQGLVTNLAAVLKADPEELLEKIPANWEYSWNPVELLAGVDYNTVVRLAENSELFPGVSWSSKPYRWYNNTGSISHILGYVGNITTEELQVLYNEGYANTASLGKTGAEKTFDTVLRGEDGRIYRTVDVKGRNQGKEDITPPKNGLDVVLTIDRHIQELAEKALGPRKGGMVVLRPATGEILALVSYPSFNPNAFREDGPGNFNRLSLNDNFPFLNRTLQSAYAPASTFKLVMTAALLGENAVDPNQTVNCRGVMRLGNREFKCHKRSGHGSLNLRGALENSCNIYFGTMGVEKLGIEVISDYARRFGLGSVTGIELDGEVKGIVPTKAWKEDTYNTPWTGGDTLNSCIGQGFLLVTPLQVANVLAAIANDGKVYRPHILKSVRNARTGQVLQETEPELLHTVEGLEDEDWDYLQSAMRGVVTEGTGIWAIYTQSVEIAGKTGTGEVGLDDRWHDWFVAYGPWQTPNPEERVVVVAIAEADENYDWWAPKATDIVFEGIFGNRTYEEVIEEWRRRRIWWSWDTLPLPRPGYPYERPKKENEDSQ